MFVRPYSTLEFMKIAAGYMNVSLGHADPVWEVHAESDAQHALPLILTALDLSVVATAEGSIDSRYLDVRKADLHTAFGSIKGTYALRDELYLRSRTGAVNITVNPKIGDGSGRVLPNFTVRSDFNPFHPLLPTFDPKDVGDENSSIRVKSGYGLDNSNMPSGYINMTWKELGV